MNLSEWSQFLATKGIQTYDQQGFGVIDRYPLSLQLMGKPTSITSIIVKVQLAQPLKKNIRKELKNQLKHLAVFSYVGRTLQMTVRTSGDKYPYDFSQTLIALISFLSNHQIQEQSSCPICGQYNTDALAYYQGAYQKLHRHCIEDRLDQQESSVEENETNGSYLLGLVGALLGGCVGMIPNILTTLFAQRIYVLLYALIPICIYYGYRLLRGKLNVAAVVITVILSVFFLFFMEYIVLVLEIYRSYNIWLFSDCLQLFFERQYFGELIRSMGSSFIFLALGILYSWRMITDNNKRTTTSIEFIRSTIHSQNISENNSNE